MDIQAIKDQAFRFWEWARMIYLFMLVPPAVIGYFVWISAAVSEGIHPAISNWEVGLRFLICFLVANILYSIVYAIEFLTMGTSLYPKVVNGRPALLFVGCAIGMIFAFIWAVSIADARYPRH